MQTVSGERMKVVESRNKREGHLYGWVKGVVIRSNRLYRDKYKVSSWYAFRVWAERHYNKGKK